MARPEARRRLILNADDFGRSSSINRAVLRAHTEGVLTTASLMVNEPCCDEAVQMARDLPRLGVGLHLTLLCGRSTLGADRIPGLVNAAGEFGSSPAGVGFRYFARPRLRSLLRDEIAAQFEHFHQTGLKLDHLNGHLHLHLHPVIFDLLMENAADWGITHLRLTREPFWLDARLAGGRWLQRVGYTLIFHPLCRRARRMLHARKIRHTRCVFGLLRDSRITEDYLLRLLPNLPPGDSELYAHPSLDNFAHELDALLSPKVKALAQAHAITLIRYQDL